MRVFDEVYLVIFFTFSAVGATIGSFFRSSQFRPDLCILFMGGDNIIETTVVVDLQAKLKEFCRLIENITNSHVKVSMLEPRTRLHGVQADTYNKVRNSLNHNLQHRDPYFRLRYFITPLKFEYLLSDGVHPITFGIASFVWKVRTIACEYLYAHHASQA